MSIKKIFEESLNEVGKEIVTSNPSKFGWMLDGGDYADVALYCAPWSVICRIADKLQIPTDEAINILIREKLPMDYSVRHGQNFDHWLAGVIINYLVSIELNIFEETE